LAWNAFNPADHAKVLEQRPVHLLCKSCAEVDCGIAGGCRSQLNSGIFKREYGDF
jgi:hypothetical protein